MVGCGPNESYCHIVFLLGWGFFFLLFCFFVGLGFIFLHFFCFFCFLSTFYGCGYLIDFLVFTFGGVELRFSFLLD